MNQRVTIALLIACFALAGAGADKPPKQKPAKEKPAVTEKPSKKTRGESSNASIATQQKTAKALDKKYKEATTQPSDAPAAADEDLQAAMDDLDAEIRAEDARHEAALTQLNAAEEAAVQSGKQKEIAKARKAVDKERTAHDRTRASLDKQRETLAKKLAPPETQAGKKATRS